MSILVSQCATLGVTFVSTNLHTYIADSFDACLQVCASTAECAAIVMSTSTRQCWLKKNLLLSGMEVRADRMVRPLHCLGDGEEKYPLKLVLNSHEDLSRNGDGWIPFNGNLYYASYGQPQISTWAEGKAACESLHAQSELAQIDDSNERALVVSVVTQLHFRHKHEIDDDFYAVYFGNLANNRG